VIDDDDDDDNDDNNNNNNNNNNKLQHSCRDSILDRSFAQVLSA
jgi:hypothetical protein